MGSKPWDVTQGVKSKKRYSTRTPAEVGICGSIMTSHSAATDIAQVRNDARTK